MRVAGAYYSFTFTLLLRIAYIVPALTSLNLNLTTVKSQIKYKFYTVRQKEIIKQGCTSISASSFNSFVGTSRWKEIQPLLK
jgi:hypothetical protein